MLRALKQYLKPNLLAGLAVSPLQAPWKAWALVQVLRWWLWRWASAAACSAWT